MTNLCNHTQAINNQRSRNRGVTLIELVVAILIISIVSVGAVNYQYFGTRMAHHADAQITAARTARLILDNWKKKGGDENFNLIDLNMGFTQPAKETYYLITVNQLPLTVTLAWQDVEIDADAGVGLRQLEITIQWRADYKEGQVIDTDPSYITTTYVRRDESEG
jgi:prepilin-type N-terminal cleavage/methylation domain-containing protein